MSAENLEKMFRPESIAVIGATNRKGSIGLTIMENLVNSFKGKVYPVNPKRKTILGMECLPRVTELSVAVLWWGQEDDSRGNSARYEHRL